MDDILKKDYEEQILLLKAENRALRRMVQSLKLDLNKTCFGPTESSVRKVVIYEHRILCAG